MQAYIVRRIVEMVPTIFLISVLVFLLHRFLPGDILLMMVGELGDDDSDLERVRELLGLDKSAPQAYLDWILGLPRGDLGMSLLSQTPITEELFWRWPISIELAVLALTFVIVLGIPIGIIAAVRQETWIDYLLRGFAILGLSLPSFWIGVMVVTLPALYWGVLLRQDYVTFTEDPLKNLSIMAVPAFILAIHYIARIARMMRATLLEVLRQDYIRTAWAKGLRERVVLSRHAARNALNPVVTLLGLEFMTLMSGTVVMERIFDIPGLGNYVLEALNFRDYPVVQSVILLYAIVVVVGNLLVDLSYRMLDPRVSYK